MNPASPRDNFYRCMTLIVDNGNEAAWELLDFYLSQQGSMLKDFIENNQHEIYHLCFNKGLCCRCQYGPVYKPQSRILYPAQLDILLATKGSNIPCNVHVRAKPTCSHTINDHYANPNIATKQLDLTLCRCLLINFTNILPQGSVERNAFEDLINMRNKCCHAAKGEISSNNYQTYKAQIEKCLLALAQVYGKTHDMQLKIKDAEKRPLDESICKQLQQTILQEQVLQGVSGLHKHMESSQEAEERTTIEIQKMGKSTKRTLRAVNSSMKSAGHTASKITKIEESTKRTLMVVKSSKRSVERKLKVNTERTTHAIDSSREAEESMATKIQKLDERLSICETSKRSRLLGLTQTEIEGHLMEGTFVETAAVQACIKLLETNSLIVLTGAAGTGKSRNSLEILHQFRVKHPEYDTVKLTDLHDFADVVTAEEKLVILFEDIFGRTNTRFTENTDVQIIDRLHASTIKGNVKVILTVRNTIRTSCQWVFISHKIFHGTCEVDLSSQKFKMTATEKKSLLSKYFVVNNFRLLEVEDQENYLEETILDPQIAVTINRETLNTIVETEPFLGFPEACSLFTGNRKLTRLGLSFFKHPSKYLFEEIEKLRINGADNHQDRMSYITLVYIFLNDDILDPEDIDSERCLEISESCYGISYKKFPTCHIRDAANWMIGKYLTLRCNKDTYHFQHQTILESILISYSRIDQNLILSRLSFDFIRELVRLQNYLLKEGEIVMKISPKYYQKLADRIIKIVQSEYFNNSLSITIQLLCDSEILRENDERFVKCLIDKAHDVYFQPDYALQSCTTNNGEFRLCKLYLPALFLGRIVQLREMNKTITLLLDHLKFILTSDSGDDIKFVCNSSLSEAFLHVCELESNEKILDNVWESVMNLNMFKMIENMHSIISTVCSKCPVTTMKWMLNNIDRSTFEMNHLMNRACEFKRLDVVQLICASVNHDQLDFTSAFLVALNNVRNDPDELVSKWLIKNIGHQLFDMKKITSQVLVVGCVDDLNFLLQNVDNNILDMELVFTQVCKKKRHIVESFLKWMVTNVEKKKLNTHEMLILACIAQDIAVVKYLINNVDHNLLDLTVVLMSAVSSYWRGSNIDLIKWLFLHVDLKHIDMLDIINKAFQEVRYEEIKTLITCSKDNFVNINHILKNACENTQMELIKVVLSVVDHLRLNIRDAVRSVCVLPKMDLLEFFLHNVDQSLYNANYVIEISCRFGWVHILKWLLDNVEYSSSVIHEAITIVLHGQFRESNKTLVLMLKKIDTNQVDIKAVMNTACSRSHFDVVQWLLSNVDNYLFDMPTAFNKAIHAYRPDLTVSLIQLLIDNIDHKLIDMASLLKIENKDCLFDIVECVLRGVDHKVFDVQLAFNTIYAGLMSDEISSDDDNDINYKKEKYLTLINLILDKVNHELLDLKNVLNQACRDCSSYVVKLLLENTDHKKLDVKKAMNIVYNLWVYNKRNKDERAKGQNIDIQYSNEEEQEENKVGEYENDEQNKDEMEEQEAEKEENESGDKEDEDRDRENINKTKNKYKHLVMVILKQVNHDSLDLKKVFNHACQYGCFDVVSLVLENKNHNKVDIMKAVSIINSSVRNDFDDSIDQRKNYELLIKIILEKVNHDALDFKEILNKACCYGCLNVVTFVLENIDLKESDIMEAVNIVCDPPYLNNVNRDSIVLKIMHKASCSGYLEVVTFVLENTDHKKIDVMEAVNIVYSAIIETSDNMIDQKEKYEPLIRQILEKVDHDLLDLKTVFKHAFCKRCLDVVRNLLENTDHGKLDVKRVMNTAFNSLSFPTSWKKMDNKRGMEEPIIKLILERVNNDALPLKEIMNYACYNDYLDVVKYLIENTDQDKLDVKGAMNIVMNTSFDSDMRMDKSRKLKGPVIKLILEKVKHNSLALKEIMNYACCNGLLDVVTCLLEHTDHKKLDIMEAVNDVYLSVCDNDYDYDVMNNLRETYDPLIRHILEKVNHDLLDLKTIFHLACRIGCLEVVTYLLENINHNQLDVMEAVNDVYLTVCANYYDYDVMNNFTEAYDPLIRHILEKVNHDLLDLKTIFHLACRIGCLEVVAYLLENINHNQLDVKGVVNDVYLTVCDNYYDYDVMNNLRETYDPLIRHILEKVNHDLLDLKTLFRLACRIGCLEVVTYLLENTNHDQLDIRKTVYKVYRSVFDGDYDYDEMNSQREKYELLIRHILEKVNHDLLDLKTIFVLACRRECLEVVTYLLENNNHDQVDVKEAVNDVFRSVSNVDYYNDDMNNLREKYELLIRNILEKVNHDLLDMKTIFYLACRIGCLEVVTNLLENIDHDQLDIRKAVNDVCHSVSIDDYYNDVINNLRETYEPLIRHILEKVNHDLLDLQTIFHLACRIGCLEVVTYLLENIDHNQLDVKGVVNDVYLTVCDNYYDYDVMTNFRETYDPLIRHILEKVNHDLLDLKTIFHLACRIGCLEVVAYLLENINHNQLHVKEVVNDVYLTVCDNYYDYDVMNNLRETYDPLIRHILEKVNHDLLDLKTILHLACRIGCLEVVTYLLENTNHDQLDIRKTVYNVYRSVFDGDYDYDEMNSQREKYELLIRHILEKVNHDLLDLKTIFVLACRRECLEVVAYLLENNNHDQVDVKEAVNNVFRSVSNLDYYNDGMNNLREKYELLIRNILEKVNPDLLDMKTIFYLACRRECLEVVTYLLENNNHDQVDVKEAVNDVFRSVSNVDYYNDGMNNLREKYELLIRNILEKVNPDLLDMKTIFYLACRIGCLEVVTYLLENIDHDQLDIRKAVNDVCHSVYIDDDYNDVINNLRETYDPLIRHILEKVNHDLLDLKTIFHLACRIGCLEVVTYLLENINHDQLDVKEAVDNLYLSVCDDDDYNDFINNLRETYDFLIRNILEKVNHDLLDMKTVFHLACRIGCLEVVTYLLENINHNQLDIMEAVNDLYRSVGDDDYDYDFMNNLREKYEPLIRHILEKVSHDLLDLKTIFHLACRIGCLEVVRYLLENINHETLYIMEALSKVLNSKRGYIYIHYKREWNETLLKLVFEKVNSDLLDLKKIFNWAFCYRCLDTVTYLLENTDHNNLAITAAVTKACSSWINENTDDNFYHKSSNTELIKLLRQKVKTNVLDMEVVLNEACRNELLDIVRWLVENVAHSMFDIDTSMNVLMLHSTENNFAIFKFLLENISQHLFDIGSVIEQASRLNHTEKVLWILQTKDNTCNTLFDIKNVMNEACRNSNLQIIRYVLKNIDKGCFDVISAMNKACRSSKSNSLHVVKWLLDNIPHDMFDLEIAMNNACRYDNVVVVQWFWNNLDRKLFNVRTAWNNACYNCNEALLSYLLNNMDENMLDKSKAMSQACRNYKEGYRVISLLFEQPNMNTPENCKNVLQDACIHSNRPIVEWLLENADIQPSELKEMLIYTIKGTINKVNDVEQSDHKYLVWFMLKHPKVKELKRNNLSEVMEAISSIGQLDMVQELWDNTEKNMFNMRVIINTACESGKYEIVDWFLQNIDLKSIDVQTVMVESCGYGWLKIVKLLLSKFNRDNFDMNTSMDEACSYGRYEIVKFLLENFGSSLLDTKLVLEKSCGYGWKDIILWLFAKIENISIDLKTCMFEACTQGRLEIVKLFLLKYGANNFDVNMLIDISCKNSGNADVMTFLIENFDLKQSHLDIVIKTACTYSWTDIVSSTLDRCKHDKNIMEEAMKNACISGETEIVKLFLDKVDISLLGLRINMVISCQKGWDEIVSLLLKRVDHSLFDLTVAMHEACRCGEADIVELLIQKVDHKFFNFENAIKEACQSHLNENLVLILLKYINNSTWDKEGMSKKARENGWRKVSSRLKRMTYNEN